MTFLQQPHFEQQRIVLLFDGALRQDVEAGLRSARAQRLVDELECIICHLLFFLFRSGSTTENCSRRSAGSTRSRLTRNRSPIENSRFVCAPTILRTFSRYV